MALALATVSYDTIDYAPVKGGCAMAVQCWCLCIAMAVLWERQCRSVQWQRHDNAREVPQQNHGSAWAMALPLQ